MVKRRCKATKKKEQSSNKLSGFTILQPDKFRKLIIVTIAFIFIMAILIFLSFLNNTQEEGSNDGKLNTVSSGIFSVTTNGSTQDSTKSNSSESESIWSSISWLPIVMGFFIAWNLLRKR